MNKRKMIIFCICLILITGQPSNKHKTYASKKENEPKTICLTFDDGPSNVTNTILDILKDKNVTATFFVCGKNVNKHKDITKRILSEGHTIAIHSFSHEYKNIYASEQNLREDIIKCFYSIKNILPTYTPKLYRFPGGSFGLSKELINVPKTLGLTYVDWNASCRDCEISPLSPNELTTYAITTSHNKNHIILLMHDSSTKQMTAKALPEIIDYYKENEFSFFSVEKALKIT
jgi:peptidoglycan/xylan/chitin deacetylase (PgdA/CDA1 family)